MEVQSKIDGKACVWCGEREAYEMHSINSYFCYKSKVNKFDFNLILSRVTHLFFYLAFSQMQFYTFRETFEWLFAEKGAQPIVPKNCRGLKLCNKCKSKIIQLSRQKHEGNSDDKFLRSCVMEGSSLEQFLKMSGCEVLYSKEDEIIFAVKPLPAPINNNVMTHNSDFVNNWTTDNQISDE